MFGGRLGLGGGGGGGSKKNKSSKGFDDHSLRRPWQKAREQPLPLGVVAAYLSFQDAAPALPPVPPPPPPPLPLLLPLLAPAPAPPPPPPPLPLLLPKHVSPPAPAPADMLWTERFRVASVKDMIGQPKTREKLQKWMSDRLENRAGVPLIAVLSGPAGTGKTTMAHALFRDFGIKGWELNASESRTYDAIMDHLTVSCLAKKSGAILDEIDGAVAEDFKEATEGAGGTRKSGWKAIQDFVKQWPNRILGPIICTCNDLANKNIRLLCEESLHVKFFPYYESNLKAIASRILKATGRYMPDSLLQVIIQASHGDVRALLNSLQFPPKGVGGVTLRDLSAQNLFEAFKMLVAPSSPAISKMILMAHDTQAMTLLMHENLLGKVAPTLEIARPFLEDLGDMDVWHGTWNTAWQPDEYSDALLSYQLLAGGALSITDVKWPAHFEWERKRRDFHSLKKSQESQDPEFLAKSPSAEQCLAWSYK